VASGPQSDRHILRCTTSLGTSAYLRTGLSYRLRPRLQSTFYHLKAPNKASQGAVASPVDFPTVCAVRRP
jgi:hypothetical protein